MRRSNVLSLNLQLVFLACKYYSAVEVTYSGEHYSLFQYGINYGRKKFAGCSFGSFDNMIKKLFVKKLFFSFITR
jgi:hypothetical protein